MNTRSKDLSRLRVIYPPIINILSLERNSLTIDSKLPLHSICAHLLAAKLLGIVINVFEIVLSGMSDRERHVRRQLTSNLPSIAIA